DLHPAHPGTTTQIYVRNRITSTLLLASRATGGAGEPGAGSSTQPSISADGRFVAFTSASNNLTDTDGTDTVDVFVRDLQSSRTTLVSRATDGTPAAGTSNQPAISPDGRYVAFTSNANNLSDADADGTKDVFLHDRSTGKTSLVSVGGGGAIAQGDSQNPAISGLGTTVVFESTAPSLVAADPQPNSDIFAVNPGGAPELVSVTTDGSPAAGGSFNPSVSADGMTVGFESDANLTADSNPAVRDVFVRTRATSETQLASKASGGNGAASDGASDQASVSPEGGFVAFRSAGTNLSSLDADPDADVFVRDLSDGALALVSRPKGGPAADGASGEPFASGAAGTVLFSSTATNLTATAPGGGTNVFAASMRSSLGVTATEPPTTTDTYSRFDTDVTCSASCLVWATGKIISTDTAGNDNVRSAAGYGAQSLSAGSQRRVSVTLLPAARTWLRQQIAAGRTISVEIKLQAIGMRGETATGYSRGPLTILAAAPAAN
ncbi:MAG: PD40 domain-containing protein, partial [Solirubrobacteraceae bacterium]|nr:PD40 domain-containing protein [Solirubrobacteraceae bacterium]